MLDIHAHILPQVDDGAKSRRQALQMLLAARDVGIDILVATPHLYKPQEDLARITDAYYWLKPRAQAVGIHLLKGFEISYKVLLDLPCSELGRYCISGTNILLLELDSFHLFPHWANVLGSLVQAGYEPVIAHPERYVYIQDHLDVIEEMRKQGCRMQIDAHAFLKPPWSTERYTARKLMNNGAMDYIATDAHDPQDYRQMRAVMRRFQKHLPRECISPDSILGLSSS